MRVKVDENRQVVCPNCEKVYTPVLKPVSLKDDRRPIQQIYPNSDLWEREQLITGICCDRCWDEYLGTKGGVYTEGGKCIAGTWRYEDDE